MLLTIEIIKTQLTPVFAEHKVKEAILFGSYSRGEETPYSDVDIYVDSGLGGLSFFGLLEDVCTSIPIRVDLVDRKTLSQGNPILTEIRKTGIMLYSQQEGLSMEQMNFDNQISEQQSANRKKVAVALSRFCDEMIAVRELLQFVPMRHCSAFTKAIVISYAIKACIDAKDCVDGLKQSCDVRNEIIVALEKSVRELSYSFAPEDRGIYAASSKVSAIYSDVYEALMTAARAGEFLGLQELEGYDVTPMAW